MDDPVLMSRLEALWNNLNVVSEKLRSSAWRSEQPEPGMRAELLAESLWTGLETTLVRQIDARKDRLKEVEEELDRAASNDHAALTAAWVRYAKIQRDSQSLMRECFGIIGTLAIRNNDLDERMLYVADELIRDCLVLSTGDTYYYLLVHGMEDTFSKTRARIIRLRFPEWTIWDLPLAAHELGHVVLAETEDQESLQDDDDLKVLTRFLGNQRDSLVGQDAELNQRHQSGSEGTIEAEQLAESRVRVFLADAFATYTMGPAYACSAIMLRLNPSISARRERPSDAQRAHVVLSMLRWMNEAASLPRPYTDVIERLEDDWSRTLDRVNPDSRPSQSERMHLGQLAESFGGDVSHRFLRRAALYPYQPGQNDGWGRAQEWSAAWLTQLENNEPRLGRPANPAGKLRDVLNAAWLSRLQVQGDVRTKVRAYGLLADAGQDLCQAIIAAKGAPLPVTPSLGGVQ